MLWKSFQFDPSAITSWEPLDLDDASQSDLSDLTLIAFVDSVNELSSCLPPH